MFVSINAAVDNNRHVEVVFEALRCTVTTLQDRNRAPPPGVTWPRISVCIVHSSLPLPSAVGRGYSPSWDLFVFCVSLMLDCPYLKRFSLCLLDNPGSILEWSETYITGVFTSFFFFLKEWNYFPDPSWPRIANKNCRQTLSTCIYMLFAVLMIDMHCVCFFPTCWLFSASGCHSILSLLRVSGTEECII